jgi:sugar lactone lactonase YvrE
MSIVRRFPFRAQSVLAFATAFALLLGGCTAAEQAPAPQGIEIADAGFATPESVLADPVADVYLVSNINGNPAEKDDNGFISRVTPDGQVENLKWIDGAAPNVTLHAPKGSAIRGDTLFVADIDCIRRFHRVTGEPAGEQCIPGATFLNDVAIGPDGALYVTDSGLAVTEAGFGPSGTDAVYRFPLDTAGGPLLKRSDLGAPNGIAVEPRRVVVVTFLSGELFQISEEGQKIPVLPASTRQLDGVVFTPDGGMLFSSWGDSAVYRVAPAGASTRLITGLNGPADIGFDAKRGRVLIPVFNENKVIIRDVSTG